MSSGLLYVLLLIGAIFGADKITAIPIQVPVGQCLNLNNSTVWQDSLGWDGNPERAIDGNKNQDYWGLSCSHTQDAGKHWLVVSFGQLSSFNNVRITNRLDCCTARLNNFTIYTSKNANFDPNNPLHNMEKCLSYSTNDTVPGFFDFTVSQPCEGYFAMLYLDNKNQPLTICEIEFCNNGPAPVEAPVGQCLNLNNSTVWQDSLGWDGNPERAIDGNKNQDYWGLSCSHTQDAGKHWLVVSFGQLSSFNNVRITNRLDCCTARLNNFTIYTSKNANFNPNNPLHNMEECLSYNTNDTVPGFFDLTVSQPCEGYFAMLYLDNKNQPLTICEIEFCNNGPGVSHF